MCNISHIFTCTDPTRALRGRDTHRPQSYRSHWHCTRTWGRLPLVSHWRPTAGPPTLLHNLNFSFFMLIFSLFSHFGYRTTKNDTFFISQTQMFFFVIFLFFFFSNFHLHARDFLWSLWLTELNYGLWTVEGSLLSLLCLVLYSSAAATLLQHWNIEKAHGTQLLCGGGGDEWKDEENQIDVQSWLLDFFTWFGFFLKIFSKI
jgi:hypothetical protein